MVKLLCVHPNKGYNEVHMNWVKQDDRTWTWEGYKLSEMNLYWFYICIYIFLNSIKLMPILCQGNVVKLLKAEHTEHTA